MSINGKERGKNMNQSAVLRVIEGGPPTNENGKVANRPPIRVKNAHRREREYLTEAEVDALLAAARKRGRWGVRDAALILFAYRHGFRVSELVGLKWSAVDLDSQQLHVTRRKNGKPAVHPLPGDQIRLLRKLKAACDGSAFVFTSERGGPLSTSAVRYLVAQAGVAAKLPFPVHPHMLRHGTGFKFANDGVDTRTIQDYLGHKSIQHTVRYTELAPERYNGLWGDR